MGKKTRKVIAWILLIAMAALFIASLSFGY